jgi:maltose alpha-D-glucosyltransferase / alpha-amylase
VWFERMLHTLRECPEVGAGRHTAMTVGPTHVLVHQVTHGSGALLLLHNLSRTPARVDVRTQVEGEVDGPVLEVFGDRDYGEPDLAALELATYGYRWIRLRGDTGRP